MTEKTNDIIKIVLISGFVIILIVLAATYGMGNFMGIKPSGSNSVIDIVTLSPTPIPTVAPIYPSVITYTVSAATTSNGQLEIDTSTGEILYCTDYATWQKQLPLFTYTAMISGRASNGVMIISSAQLISQPSRTLVIGQDAHYPTYYHYGGKYYQYDGNEIDPMQFKQVKGEHLIEGRPPNYNIYHPPTEFYYHYDNKYWQCIGGTCSAISISRVPAYVTIHETMPPFNRKY